MERTCGREGGAAFGEYLYMPAVEISIHFLVLFTFKLSNYVF